MGVLPPVIPRVPIPKAILIARTTPLEREIEKPVCDYAKRLGFYCAKFVSPAHRSVPDRLFISPTSRVFFIEFKRPGGKPTPDQLREHEAIRKFGINVYVIDNIPEGKALVDRYK